jgi:small subunit ribosomal protein S15
MAEGSVEKTQVVEKFRVHEKDTGSPEVQIALLTKRLEQLTEHFKRHPQDKHSKRGLLAVVSKRKRLLQYLMGEDVNRYRSVISSLGLRK